MREARRKKTATVGLRLKMPRTGKFLEKEIRLEGTRPSRGSKRGLTEHCLSAWGDEKDGIVSVVNATKPYI